MISFLSYFQRGDVLLYGDAVAHINIARRVFDSKTPGLLQLGTVWLPLPHLLMVPFLISDEMWRRGVGGSIPSMAAYVFGVIGMFRLVRGVLSHGVEPDAAARVAAWTAALVYAANPNLIYLQTTAMGEAIYLAFFIWAVVYFSEWMRGDARALTKCGLYLAATCLTRYDGWFLAVAITATMVWVSVRSGKVAQKAGGSRFSRAAVTKFVLISAAAPLLWLAYNGIVYRNPLEFANGPYSAKAIERRSQNSGSRGIRGSGNPVLAGMYFLKSAEDNLAENEWLQRAWILIAVGGAVAAALTLKTDSNTPGRIFSSRVAAVFFSCSAALLRVVGSLWGRPNFRSTVVAVLSLQRPLRIAAATGFRRGAGDHRAWSRTRAALEPATARCMRARGVRVRDRKLRLNLAHCPGFIERSAGQHAHAQPT